jgi:transposase
VDAVAQELGISVDTLERWRSEAVLTTAPMDEAARGTWCRKSGMYPQELEAWRQAATAALADPPTPQQTRQDRRRIRELERDVRRKDRALAETTALLVLS